MSTLSKAQLRAVRTVDYLEGRWQSGSRHGLPPDGMHWMITHWSAFDDTQIKWWLRHNGSGWIPDEDRRGLP